MVCIRCGASHNLFGQKNGHLIPRKLCGMCFAERRKRWKGNWRLRKHKGASCENCGFVALHPCQLDVDHIDGNRDNDASENLRTLCANCHRLKTQLAKDHSSWMDPEPEEPPQLRLVE